jgi:hypothetical protein
MTNSWSWISAPTNPTVFTGSSNLAAGGETQNGDSLTMIEDQSVAMMYAIEAIAMFDHYHFRKAMQRVTVAEPLSLWYPGKPNAPTPWWKEYYDPQKIQLRDRCLFANVPLPPGVDTKKTVDWDAGGAAPAKKGRSQSGGAAQKRTASKSKPTSAKRAPSKSRRRPAKKAPAKKAPAKSRRAPARKAPGKKRAPANRRAPAKKRVPAKKRAPARRATAKKAAKKGRARRVHRKPAAREVRSGEGAARKGQPARKPPETKHAAPAVMPSPSSYGTIADVSAYAPQV